MEGQTDLTKDQAPTPASFADSVKTTNLDPSPETVKFLEDKKRIKAEREKARRKAQRAAG
jgi:hypothetical protein